MDIFELMNRVISCGDLSDAAERLTVFVDAALAEEDKEEIVNAFYQGLLDNTMMDYIESQEEGGCGIYTGENAVGKYLSLIMPPHTTPVRTLKQIKKSAGLLKQYITGPLGDGMSEEKVREIMEYVDREYQFPEIVFEGRKAMVCMLDYSHGGYDSEYITMDDGDGMSHHMIMFHMNNRMDIAPEAVFFHELGHALHARYTGSLKRLPEDVIRILTESCMPGIAGMEDTEKVEVVADVLGMGLMYGSPYMEYDNFSTIKDHDKKFFNAMVRRMFELIREQRPGRNKR